MINNGSGWFLPLETSHQNQHQHLFLIKQMNMAERFVPLIAINNSRHFFVMIKSNSRHFFVMIKSKHAAILVIESNHHAAILVIKSNVIKSKSKSHLQMHLEEMLEEDHHRHPHHHHQQQQQQQEQQQEK